MVSIFVTSTITSTSSSDHQSHAVVLIIDNNNNDNEGKSALLRRALPLYQLSNRDCLLPSETATTIVLKRV